MAGAGGSVIIAALPILPFGYWFSALFRGLTQTGHHIPGLALTGQVLNMRGWIQRQRA